MDFSGSSIPRVMECPGSAVLPHVSSESEYGTRGTVIHQFLADVPQLGAAAALERVPAEHRAACEQIDLSRLPACRPDAYAVEVAIAYNVDTGEARELGRGVNRRYEGIGPREIPGTLDVVGLSPDAVLVIDYKSGHARLAPAVEHHQVRFYALAAAKLFGRTRATVGIIRLGEDGSPWFDTGTLDEFDLATVQLELSDLGERVATAAAQVGAGKVPALAEGDHCRYCPAYTICPAKMALVRQMAAAPEALEQLLTEATDAQLAEAWKRATAAEKVIERVKDVLKKRAREVPLDLGNGYVLGPVKEEVLDLQVAIAVLATTYGPEVAEAAIEQEPRVTKAGLDRALRTHVLKTGMKITHLNRAALEAIRAAGGIGFRTSVERHRPKPPKLPESTETTGALPEGVA